jgi:hypothetical protein
MRAIGLRLCSTASFSVIDVAGGNEDTGADKDVHAIGPEKQLTTASSCHRMSIFLDVDESYTRRLIERAFRHPLRARHFQVFLGPGVGMEPIPLPPYCEFQWAEYERIDWHGGVLVGKKHGASSYCIRKGISRKAQLAHYTYRHVCKNPNSILKQAIPQTLVLDCWSAWETDGGRMMTNHGGLADVVASLGGVGNDSSMNRRERLDHCLAEAKAAMQSASCEFEGSAENNATAEAPIWILKGSTTNKGAGIYIVHVYEQVVDHCWNEPEIREWYA